MKIEFWKYYESPKCWTFGIHTFSFRLGCFVILLGTNWAFGFSHGPGQLGSRRCFALCCGPLTIAGAT